MKDLEESIDYWEQRASSGNMTDLETIRGGGDTFQKPDFLSSHAEKMVLDIACGYGRISIPLVEEGRYVVGLDASRGMLHRFKKNVKQKRLSDIDLVLASATALPFKDHSFPLLLCLGSFCVIPKKCWKGTLNEFKRVGDCSLVEFFNVLNYVNLVDKMLFFLWRMRGKPFPHFSLSVPNKLTFQLSYIQFI